MKTEQEGRKPNWPRFKTTSTTLPFPVTPPPLSRLSGKERGRGGEKKGNKEIPVWKKTFPRAPSELRLGLIKVTDMFKEKGCGESELL